MRYKTIRSRTQIYLNAASKKVRKTSRKNTQLLNTYRSIISSPQPKMNIQSQPKMNIQSQPKMNIQSQPNIQMRAISISMNPSYKNQESEKPYFELESDATCEDYSNVLVNSGYPDRPGSFCNEIRKPGSSSVVCQFDAKRNQCILKHSILSGHQVRKQKLQMNLQMNELIEEAYRSFHLRLRELLQRKYPHLQPHQIDEATEQIKRANVQGLNRCISVIGNKIAKRVSEMKPVNEEKERLAEAVDQFAKEKEKEYEIQSPSEPVDPDKPVSEAVLEKAKEEIKEKEETIEKLESTLGEEQEELKTAIEEEKKEIEQAKEAIAESSKEESSLQQIKDYYASKGKEIEILNEKGLMPDVNKQIKLVVKEYTPEETVLKNYTETLRTIREYQKQLESLEKRVRLNAIAQRTEFEPERLEYLKLQKFAMEKESTGLVQKIQKLQKEILQFLNELKKYPLYRRIQNSDILRGEAVTLGTPKETTLQELLKKTVLAPPTAEARKVQNNPIYSDKLDKPDKLDNPNKLDKPATEKKSSLWSQMKKQLQRSRK